MKKYLLAVIAIIISVFISTKTHAACQPGTEEVVIRIVPDSWPQEISWQLAVNGSGIIGSGNYVGDTICVPTGTCLEFTINDSYGDGIYSPGGYWLYINGVQVANGNAYGFQDIVALNCPPGMHCTSPIALSYGFQWTQYEDQWYSFTPDSSGMYSLSTCDSNTCNTQLWVYTACPSLPYSDGPMGTYIYNDDQCGQQAAMTFMLVANTTYLVRVGDNQNSCINPIGFSFEYAGPVTGCMDPTACNFNPLATVGDSCYYYPHPTCQGPDLLFDSLSFVNSLGLATMTAATCDVAEGCVTGYGTRHVIRFTSKIWNQGTADYYIGTNATQPGMFNTNNCHGHAHYEGYGDYRLYDTAGFVVPAGHKNGYCVMDLCGTGQYTCGNMGISAGCYDVYGVGTQCQWVDITDVPDGDYRLAIIVNSQHLPDALNRYETNFLNNALQICIRITRNSSGVPSYSVLPNCTPFTDCNGVPGGTSMIDCNGICGGTSVFGDVNGDAALTVAEVDTYLDQIQAGFSATPCNDLNGDGALNIFDAAQMNWCIYGSTFIPGGGSHNHCRFPRNIINPQDSTELSIIGYDPINGYVDIGLRNPRSGVKGFQFTMSGINISSYMSLTNPGVAPIDLRYKPSTKEFFAMTVNDSTIPRSVSRQPILRIYYNSFTDTAICISSIAAIMNEAGEGTVASLADNCVPTMMTGISNQLKPAAIAVIPNPAGDEARLHLDRGYDPGKSITVSDAGGQLYSIPVAPIGNEWYTLDLSALAPGVYSLRIMDGTYFGSAKIVRIH
ncbi:MAG: lysyl oxidase family protein [Bacteroidota bacterium]